MVSLDRPANIARARRYGKSAGLLLALLVCAAAFGSAGFVMTGRSDASPTRAEFILARAARKAFIPIRARGISQPQLSAGSLVEGRHVYVQSCSICHGADGRGNTGIGRAMYPPVPDLAADASQQWKDRELFWIIRNGIRLTGMPAWRESLNEEQTWTVVAYLRKLADQNRERARRANASGHTDGDLVRIATETIDQEDCLGCHMLNGEGASVGPDLTTEWMRGRSDDWLIEHFKNPPHMTPGSIMPRFEHLSDEQLRALVAFLQQPR